MSTRELTCIGCPLGCAITVTMDGSTVTAVTGNTCPRGDAYARKEVTNPTRIVTSTVRVNGGIYPMANVKTASDIPKGRIFDCVNALKDITVNAPLKIGDVVIRRCRNWCRHHCRQKCSCKISAFKESHFII